MITISPKSYCRAAGILLVLTMVCGWFGEMYVPSLMMGSDAASTAAQIRDNEGLFRLGFAAYLVEAFSDIVLAWLFYALLKPVNRDLALLAAFFGLVSTTLFAVTKLFYFSAPMFLGGSAYLSAFTPDQLEGFSSMYVMFYGRLSGVPMLFYGAAWLIRGWLTYRSGYLPRFLGAIMIVAGIGFIAKTITLVLEPAYSSDVLLAPMFVLVVALALWMLFKGVDLDKWNRAHGD